MTASGFKRDGFVRRVLDYYTVDQCGVANPLIFLQDLEVALVEASGRVTEMSRSFQTADFEQLSLQCGDNFEKVNTTFYNMSPVLSDVTATIERLNGLAKCEQISPVLDNLLHGAICNETVNALTWMYYVILVMSLLMVMMLTLRAALFNVLIPGPKKKRREKEFRQYKRFMQDAGFDTSNWQMDPPKKVRLDGLDLHVETFDTVETGSTERITSERRDDVSENSFSDEHGTVKPVETSEPDGVSTIPEGREYPVEENLEADSDSVISSDTDDSSLNPPPSAMSEIASSFTGSVSSVLKRTKIWPFSSSKNSISSTTDDERERRLDARTPARNLENILGTMDEDSGDLEEPYDLEIVPLSPRPQPPAPQKTMKALRRTRGAIQFDT